MEIREHVALGEYTTMKIGGPARFFCEPTTIDEVERGVTFAHEKNIPLLILGGGSNMLMNDDEYPGLVMRLHITYSEWSTEGEYVHCIVGASELWDTVVARAVAERAWGIENLSHIPGTVGGAVVQNIGAYGSEMRNVIDWVEVYDPKIGGVKMLTSTECRFGYRDSIFKHDGREMVVTRVRLRLNSHGSPNIQYKDLATYFANKAVVAPSINAVRDAVIAIRSGKFPDLDKYGTAGSFFKNPIVTSATAENFLRQYPNAPHYDAGEGRVKLSAAWIIDHVLGMRGVHEGGVGTWDAQALVVVNYDRATSKEIKNFVKKISDASVKKINITLEPEVILVEEKKL